MANTPIIGMLLNAGFPPDIRVEKEASALIEAGFQVHIVCNSSVNKPEYELFKGMHIHRIDVPDAKKDKVMHGVWDTIAAINFVHPKFKTAVLRIAREHKFDALHVHDLPLAKTAIHVREKLGIPVVLDLHENYAEGLKTWFVWRTSPIIRLKNQIFFSYDRWNAYEKDMVHQADHIVAVVDEMKARMVKVHEISEDKVTVVTNTEPRAFLVKENPHIATLEEQYKDKFLISYIGGLGPHRGLDTAIEGIPYIKDQIPNLVFLIIGGGKPAVVNRLKQLVADHQLEDIVKFPGKVPFEQVFPYMKISDVNLIPHHANAHTDHTIPHKLFQIMLTGQPVLVSTCKPLKRIVEDANAGRVFEASNPQSFGEEVLAFYQNQEASQKMGENGFEAAYHGVYNWETTSQQLIEMYHRILKKTPAV